MSDVETTRMDAQRVAFLDDIETDLTAKTSTSTAGRASKLLSRIGTVGAVVAAGVSLFVMTPGAAHASARPLANPYCMVPNPVPYTHSKACNLIRFYRHEFLSQSPAGP